MPDSSEHKDFLPVPLVAGLLLSGRRSPWRSGPLLPSIRPSLSFSLWKAVSFSWNATFLVRAPVHPLHTGRALFSTSAGMTSTSRRRRFRAKDGPLFSKPPGFSSNVVCSFGRRPSPSRPGRALFSASDGIPCTSSGNSDAKANDPFLSLPG